MNDVPRTDSDEHSAAANSGDDAEQAPNQDDSAYDSAETDSEEFAATGADEAGLEFSPPGAMQSEQDAAWAPQRDMDPPAPDAPDRETGQDQVDPGAEGDQDLVALVADYRKKSEENREKWLRSMAELENFRKRSRREIENSINFANANLLRELLDVLDNFERAHAAVDEDKNPTGEAFVEGIRLIYQRLVEIMRQQGLERIHAKGQPFDPNLHEAVSQIETDEVASHHIVHVVQEGYTLKDMVLRPSRVVVAK